MFSGTTFTNLSGNVLGGHQKIDRSAHRRLMRTIDMAMFPDIENILHFEGKNGPDGIKSKSPGKDEPWHYFEPSNPEKGELLSHIKNHYRELVSSLEEGNREKAAFEAAWLAHALVDGLTPAHHYPYESELERLRGEGLESRDTILKKLFIPGDSMRDALKKNWEMWGSKGLLSTHALFEWGVALLIAPLQLGRKPLKQKELKLARKQGILELFITAAQDIDALGIYEAYYRRGWTRKMMKVVKKVLAPRIVETVALVWFLALDEARTGESHLT